MNADRARPPRGWRSAFGLGVANGILFNFGTAFTDTAAVLPAFVSRLTGSSVAVGALGLIAGGLNQLPQLLVANFMETRRRKLVFYQVSSLVRVACWPAIAVLTYFWADRNPALTLAVFFAGYGVYMLASGVGSIAFMDVVSRTLPANRLARFFALREIGGGALAFVAGFVVRGILGRGGPTHLGHDYALIFALGAAIIAPALLAFCLVPEREGQARPRRTPMLAFLLRAPAVLRRDANFRRFFTMQMLSGAVGIAMPFYAVYARRVILIPEAMIGIYVSAGILGRIGTNLAWAALNDRRGSLTVLRRAAALNFLVPAVALLLAVAPLPRLAAMWAFSAVFCFAGAAAAGGFIGATNYFVETSPELERPLYLGVLNTFGVAATALPMVGGIIIDHSSFQVVFAIAMAAAVAAAVFVRSLAAPPRKEAAS